MMLFLAVGCGKKKDATKPRSEKFFAAGEEISVEGVEFSEIRFSEKSKFAFLRVENGKGLYLYNFSSRKLERLEKDGIKDFTALRNCSVVFYVKKIFRFPPTYELKKYSASTGRIQKVYDTFRGIFSLQKMSEEAVVFWSGENAYYYSLKMNKPVPVEKTGRKLFYYGVEGNKLQIVDFDKTFFEKFGKGERLIWADVNPHAAEVVVYAFKSGALLFSHGQKKAIGDLRYPKISPDGRFVIGYRESYNNQKMLTSDIYVYSISDGKSVNITRNRNAIELNPCWSEDGKYFAFSNPSGKIKIWKFEINKRKK